MSLSWSFVVNISVLIPLGLERQSAENKKKINTANDFLHVLIYLNRKKWWQLHNYSIPTQWLTYTTYTCVVIKCYSNLVSLIIRMISKVDKN